MLIHFHGAGATSLHRSTDAASTRSLVRAFTAFAILAATSAHADVLLTEVIPNVTTTATRGDVVEIFNSGPGAVDLTGWVLTDMDNDPVAGVPGDLTFAPPELSLPALGAGEFAVIDLVDSAGAASWRVTNFGLRIQAPLGAGSFLGSERDELLLTDAANIPVDFVAWSDSTVTVPTDSYEDLSAVTGAVFDYGLTPGSAAWNGRETVSDDPAYYAATVDFTAFAAVSTWGGGAIRRRSTNGVFDVASPDGPAQWEAVARQDATLGNASDVVTTVDGLRPLRVTDDLSGWLAQIRSSTFPDRRIAPLADQYPADFIAADLARRNAWTALLPLAIAGQWDATFAAANALGYEVVEFLDVATGQTFHILRERFVPDDPGFTGMGTFVFYDGPGVRSGLVLEVPHPINDSLTLDEGALAIGQLRPRVTMVAGTHRNNSTVDSTCDGTQDGGDPYRESDVSHHPDNFFHATHTWLHANLAEMLTVQLHGFCCPGMAPHAGLTDDCVLSNGVEIAPGPGQFAQILRGRIDAQNFLADGVDLTTAAVFGDDANELGGTNNLQARVSNGVTVGTECNVAAVAASGRFLHLEQDPDVRDEPQHLVTALGEALDLFLAAPTTTCSATPEIGCRLAGAGKATVSIRLSSNIAKNRLTWKWSKGEATTTADFGDPVGAAPTYHVCAYDSSAEPQPLMDLAVAPGGLCAGKPCWKAASTKGFSYRSKTGNDDGVTAMKLRSGIAGRADLQVNAGGAMLATPVLPLSFPLTFQLLIDNGLSVECWQTTFSNTPLKNDEAGLLAKQ